MTDEAKRMRIEKKDYSRGKWRLVYPSGNDVYWQKPMDHPDIGQTWVTVPVCGETKQECIDETLQLLDLLLHRR
jgi:hypothetical protein